MVNSVVAVVEYSEIISESDHSAYQKTLPVTNDFNHSSKNYVNFISTNFSAQIVSTQNDDQNSER